MTATDTTARPRTVADVLPDYRRWLYRTAHDLLPGHSADFDDLVQEGWIAMWNAIASHDPDKGSLPFWLTMKARNRMRDVAGGAAWTAPTTPGKRATSTGWTTSQGDETRARIRTFLSAFRAEHHTTPTYRQIADGVGISVSAAHKMLRTFTTSTSATPVIVSADRLAELDWDTADPAGAAAFDAILTAYHDGEIAAAVDQLPAAQREYVRARFWRQESTAAMTARFGYDPHSLWRAARTNLADTLGHLGIAA